jgi:NAD(P)-dependent dehydrogenase (short-subunit alcohol dehydrogenase family)
MPTRSASQVIRFSRNADQRTSRPRNESSRRSTDISEADQVAAAFRRIGEELGPVDLLINNASASGPFRQPFVEITPESFTRGWRVGVLGAFLCSQAVIPDMLKKAAGCILFNGATSSVRGAAITFSSAKFALRGLAQALARELWPSGIHTAHIVVDGMRRFAPCTINGPNLKNFHISWKA